MPMWWRSPTTHSKPPCRCSTFAAAGSVASAAGSSKSPVIPRIPDSNIWSSSSSRSSTAIRPSWAARATSRPTRCPARSWCRCCRPMPKSWRPGCAGFEDHGWRFGYRCEATNARWPRRSNATPGMRSRSTSSSGRAISLRDLLHCRAFRKHSGWLMPRCGSSASTSATCRAPMWWRPSWCSRTVCRASPTTGTTRSGRRRAMGVPMTSHPSRK